MMPREPFKRDTAILARGNCEYSQVFSRSLTLSSAPHWTEGVIRLIYLPLKKRKASQTIAMLWLWMLLNMALIFNKLSTNPKHQISIDNWVTPRLSLISLIAGFQISKSRLSLCLRNKSLLYKDLQFTARDCRHFIPIHIWYSPPTWINLFYDIRKSCIPRKLHTKWKMWKTSGKY